VKFLKCVPLKRDRFLLNSGKRSESGNKEGTSTTSGKSVKKSKHRNMMTANWTLVLRRQKSMANAFCI
jgi:hypothetical protein